MSTIEVNKVTPVSGGTNLQIGEAGDTTNLSAGSVTLPTTIITGQTEKTTLVDADKFLISDSAASDAFKYVQKSNLPSGTLVKVGDVQSNSAASAHNLTGIFSDTYNSYFFSLSTFPITAGQYIYMQFLDSSNNAISTGYYGSVYGYDQSGGIVKYNDNGTSAVKLNESTSNARAWQGQGYIVGPTSGITNNKGVSWQSIFYDGVNVTTTQTGAYANVSATDATGMKIYSGVNLSAISLQVYGIVDTKNYNG